MSKEKQKMVNAIQEKKLQEMRDHNFELPSLKIKTKDEALDEILTKTTVTEPVIVTEYFEAESGVTLVENGKTTTNSTKRIHKFERTGKIRMNKADFTNK